MAFPQEYIGDAASLLLAENIKPFLFVRHGQTDWNAERRAQGSRDIPLNATGENQAIALRPLLEDQPIDLIVASPLTRAHVTAKLATSGLSKEIVLDAGLKERDFGPYEGTVPPGDLFVSNYEGCERSEDFSRRVAKSLGAHCSKEGRLLVAHGGVLRVILALLGTDVPPGGVDNARALKFDKDADGKWTVTMLPSPSEI